jgi:hypothetical protein
MACVRQNTKFGVGELAVQLTSNFRGKVMITVAVNEQHRRSDIPKLSFIREVFAVVMAEEPNEVFQDDSPMIGSEGCMHRGELAQCFGFREPVFSKFIDGAGTNSRSGVHDAAAGIADRASGGPSLEHADGIRGRGWC